MATIVEHLRLSLGYAVL